LDTESSKNADCVDIIKRDSVHLAYHCAVIACERYKIWRGMFLKPKDIEKVRVGSL
jgi:hypothetical protein